MSFLLKVLPIAVPLFLAGAGGTAFADPEMGKQIFKKRPCSLCHVVTRPGTEFNPMCPGLKGVKQLHSKAWMREWLKNPSAV